MWGLGSEAAGFQSCLRVTLCKSLNLRASVSLACNGRREAPSLESDPSAEPSISPQCSVAVCVSHSAMQLVYGLSRVVHTG